ncbi:Cullin family-domain-containing protein [Crepidotus variabilis]|uniref:Cullin family-domain-containing protein n=1 Tax=Crepidotus variabilis TaxID=179855 RepID=A0A9P6JP84_9AGAR|nr:Cullin family-domain-containing protein [Crepidotus variabilis]
MATVFALLSFPTSSKGLTALRTTSLATSSLDDGSESPRKVARSATDSDSASAFRSKQDNPQTKRPNQTLQIKIAGDYSPSTSPEKKFLSLLDRSIRIILTRNQINPLPASHEEIYTACRYMVVVAHRGGDLYEKLNLQLQQSLQMLVRELLSSEEKDVSWISSFNNATNWFESQIKLLKSLFTYLDQSYAANEPGVFNIRDLSYKIFSEQMFANAKVAIKIRSCVREWLEAARTQRPLPQDNGKIIPALVDHLCRHSQYSNFEEFYLNSTRTFYLEESTKKSVELQEQPTAFFHLMYEKVEEEVKRAQVLPVPAWSRVREVTEQAMWTGTTEWLAISTMSKYLKNRDFDSLSKMYTVFNRVSGTNALIDAFRVYVTNSVSNIVKDAKRDDEMVDRLLDFKALANEAINTCFLVDTVQVNVTASATNTALPRPSTSQIPAQAPDQTLIYTLTDAFTAGFKTRRSRPAEMLAKYVDKAMRKGQGKSSDVAFMQTLDKVLALYRFTDDKDVFRTFYHRSLAKRLLLEKSASDDFEKAILKKLKEEYDPEFGLGEEMFKDIALSREAMNTYHARLPPEDSGRKLSAVILKRSAWPFSTQPHMVDLPPEMQQDLTLFGEDYKSRHKSYVLDWNHALATMTLKARFRPAVKELSVSLYQGLVLLLFNDTPEIPFSDIKAQTNMEDGELRRTLQSLACAKKKVLKKVPPGREVEDGDVFKFNADFDDPHPKVHINSIQAKVSPEESRRTNENIEDDRRHFLDAAIVRIMKAKKEMTFEQLKVATIEEVKKHFVPQVESIKKRIEALVEQDYLERSVDKNKFLYVA